MKPDASPIAKALPFAVKENLPIRIGRFLAFAAFSVKPILATCGCVKIQPGIWLRSSEWTFATPAIFSTHIMASWLAL
ncbi:Uncharacterised protein [Acinetobacter baumannii]|nr:Uncharacterised protein [Acinetobacter baumannii]